MKKKTWHSSMYQTFQVALSAPPKLPRFAVDRFISIPLQPSHHEALDRHPRRGSPCLPRLGSQVAHSVWPGGRRAVSDRPCSAPVVDPVFVVGRVLLWWNKGDQGIPLRSRAHDWHIIMSIADTILIDTGETRCQDAFDTVGNRSRRRRGTPQPYPGPRQLGRRDGPECHPCGCSVEKLYIVLRAWPRPG